ncbi:MAG: FAD-binding protein [Boseongicola sp.]
MVLRPQTEKDLAEIVRNARGPLRVFGGDTRPVGHIVEGEELSISAMSGITLYEPGALTLVAKAGTPVAEIEAALTAEGQMLAFEPMNHGVMMGTSGVPTIGGVVAGNVSGPRRVHVGACRDYLLGVRFVDGRGEVIKSGGRVMKNVTGYDLVKLMAGSRGTLGVLSEVSLKVLPRPDAVATLVLNGLEDAEATSAMAAALGSPFEVTGAVHHRGLIADETLTMLRVEGFAASVAYRAEALRLQLLEFGDWKIETDQDGQAVRWQWARDVEEFMGEQGDVWCLSVKPSDAAVIAERAAATDALYDWAGGRVWLCVAKGHDVRLALGEAGGHATLVRASDETKSRLRVFQPEAPPLAALAKGLRERFDPRGILNPGLMG